MRLLRPNPGTDIRREEDRAQKENDIFKGQEDKPE